MNNIELLSKILKSTNALIQSKEYKEAYKIGNSFSRKRMLSFSNSIYFICSALRKSISTEITDFIEEHTNLKFPDISRQAFSKARQNISPEAFKELCKLIVDTFYSSNIKLKKWYGFNILAIDGTALQIPDTIENLEQFGGKENQSNIKTALATGSAIYDVLNDIIIDSTISTYPPKERKLAIDHINSITNKKLLDTSIVIFDRGYPSYEMFSFLDQKGIFFLMRAPSYFKITESVDSNDFIINYRFKKVTRKLRIVKVGLPDGKVEVLVTNIPNETITPIMFKELYFLRWGIESKYRELKSSIEIEEFSGIKPIVIKQDFYASIYLSMITALLKKEADIAIANKDEHKNLKSQYQANRNFILSRVVKNIITMLTRPLISRRIIDKILEKAEKIRSQIRHNRTYERKVKHQRKKHHPQRKSCI